MNKITFDNCPTIWITDLYTHFPYQLLSKRKKTYQYNIEYKYFMVYIYLFPGLQRYMEYCLSGPDSVLPEDYTPLDTMYPATGPIPSKTLDIVL